MQCHHLQIRPNIFEKGKNRLSMSKLYFIGNKIHMVRKEEKPIETSHRQLGKH